MAKELGRFLSAFAAALLILGAMFWLTGASITHCMGECLDRQMFTFVER